MDQNVLSVKIFNDYLINLSSKIAVLTNIEFRVIWLLKRLSDGVVKRSRGGLLCCRAAINQTNAVTSHNY